MSDSEEDVTVERQIKISLVGESTTGKSMLCARYLGLPWGGAPTQGAEVLLAACPARPRHPPVPLKLCDVAGGARHSKMLTNYLYASDIIILVYDVTNLQSFDNLGAWLTSIAEAIGPEDPAPLLALLGNKADLEHQRAVRLACAQSFAQEHGISSFTASARTGENVVIEKYTENVRFCIICNYLSKIIPALQSRCTRFRFAPLRQNQIIPRVQHIIEQEQLTVSDDGLKALLTLAGGDMRKVLNTLQSTWMAFKNVTEDNVYTCVGHPLRNDIASIIDWLLNENDFAVCYQKIKDVKNAKGLALSDILTEIHTLIHRTELPPGVLVTLLIKMSDMEQRLAAGCNENIQLASLISAFQLAKELIKPDDS